MDDDCRRRQVTEATIENLNTSNLAESQARWIAVDCHRSKPGIRLAIGACNRHHRRYEISRPLEPRWTEEVDYLPRSAARSDLGDGVGLPRRGYPRGDAAGDVEPVVGLQLGLDVDVRRAETRVTPHERLPHHQRAVDVDRGPVRKQVDSHLGGDIVAGKNRQAAGGAVGIARRIDGVPDIQAHRPGGCGVKIRRSPDPKVSGKRERDSTGGKIDGSADSLRFSRRRLQQVFDTEPLAEESLAAAKYETIPRG